MKWQCRVATTRMVCEASGYIHIRGSSEIKKLNQYLLWYRFNPLFELILYINQSQLFFHNLRRISWWIPLWSTEPSYLLIFDLFDSLYGEVFTYRETNRSRIKKLSPLLAHDQPSQKLTFYPWSLHVHSDCWCYEYLPESLYIHVFSCVMWWNVMMVQDSW